MLIVLYCKRNPEHIVIAVKQVFRSGTIRLIRLLHICGCRDAVHKLCCYGRIDREQFCFHDLLPIGQPIVTKKTTCKQLTTGGIQLRVSFKVLVLHKNSKFIGANARGTPFAGDKIGYRYVGDPIKNTRIKGRYETIECPNGATVVIDYAHNGVSLEAALNALRIYEPNRLICLFGSIGGRTQIRRAELGLVASRNADLCIITSDNPDNEPPMNIIGEISTYFTSGSCPYMAIPDRKMAIEHALMISQKGDIILLAGKGHETYQLVCGKREHFSESEIVRDYCETIFSK